MRSGRPKAQLQLTEAEVAQLQSFARSRSLPASLCQRARIVLASAGGESNTAIASRLKINKATVGKWRTSFLDKRIAGLYDDLWRFRSKRSHHSGACEARIPGHVKPPFRAM